MRISYTKQCEILKLVVARRRMYLVVWQIREPWLNDQRDALGDVGNELSTEEIA